MAGAVIELSETNFEQEVVKSPIPVLVDLWAAWCLEPEAQVSLDWYQSCEARQLQTGQPVMSLEEHGLGFGRISTALVSRSLGHCVQVTTETGRQLRVTDDHRLLTREGWKPAVKLRADMEVAVCPVLEPTNMTGLTRWILTSQQIKQASLPRMKLPTYLSELKRQGLLPLRTTHPRLPLIARLIGALFSDGHLYHHDSNNYREIMFVVGQREDAEHVCNDLRALGFVTTVKERTTFNQIDGRNFSSHTYRVKCTSTSGWLFFKALGVPIGNKTNGAYVIPPWILSAPKGIQREFLAGYLGGDGPTPVIRLMPRKHKQPCDHLGINDIEFHKRVDLTANGSLFAKQLGTLLRRFGVGVRGVHVEKTLAYRKDGSQSVTIHVGLSATYKSGYALCHQIGYAYAISKSSEAQRVGEFLRKKLFERAHWQHLYRRAKRLSRDHGTIPAIAKRLGVPYNTMFVWLRRGVQPTIQRHNERYHAWLKRTTQDSEPGLLWERVATASPIYLPEVARLGVEPQHNLIANGFVVHNCGPCRVIAPVVEELAGTYQGKMKMSKLNVDDHPQIAAQYRIMNIPTLLLFKGGKEVDRIVGVVPKEELSRRLDRVLS